LGALKTLVDRLRPEAADASNGRIEGYLPLACYGALGDGRSVVLSGSDGSIDWWCVPNMDSPPLFDRLLDAERGGRFSLVPENASTATTATSWRPSSSPRPAARG
jgi:GH15 family glucan-1,4-alpha-glucosidase